MTATDGVLAAAGSRAGHLQALLGAPPETREGWFDGDALRASDLDAAVESIASEPGGERRLAASLLVQSPGHRVAAVLGLPWPSPAAGTTSVRLVGVRARAPRLGSNALGEAGNAGSLVEAAFASHLAQRAPTLRPSQHLGEGLVRANIAASRAGAYRDVEGSAPDRGDAKEQPTIRWAAELLASAPGLEGTGSFEADSADWGWERSACCRWYRTAGGPSCEGCSLRREEGP